MMQHLPVLAVIPNYNMGRYLQKLLPTLLEQDYDGVVVLDDASGDESVDIVRQFGADVRCVPSDRNRGAPANRNRILEEVDEPAIVHFLDADMELRSAHPGAAAREIMARYASEGVGVVGGLVLLPDGDQEPFNYGPRISARTTLDSMVIRRVLDSSARPRTSAWLRATMRLTERGWPDPAATPSPRRVFWNHEGNMVVDLDAFRKVGGYDPAIPYHEIQDLAIRLEDAGIARWFDPAICARHLMIDVRGRNRRDHEREGKRMLRQRYGMWGRRR